MIKRCVTFVAAVAVLLLALPATTAMAQSGGGWTVIRSTTQGGGASSAGAYLLRGSVGSAAGTVSGGGYTVRGGFWQPGLQAPLAVTLAGFTARQDGASILVEWQTVSEIDCTGFNLYRGTNDDWAGASLLAFVPSQAPGSAQGFEYNYRDAEVEPGPTYYYWLEDVDLGGQGTVHGPVTAALAGPTAVTMAVLTTSAGETPVAPVWLLPAMLFAALAALPVVTYRQKRS